MAGAGEWQTTVEGLVREEEVRFSAVPAGGAAYGTAGFRDRADKLDRVIFRMGVLAALRSKVTQATIGVMVTASHNPVQDNGVKVVDPLGEMLQQEWEGHANLLANASTEDLSAVLQTIVQDVAIDTSQPAKVTFARDTRPSGEHLTNLLRRSLELIGAEVTDYGVLTTPQLHYMVRCVNTDGAYGTPTEQGYYEKMASAFHSMLPVPPATPSVVRLDAANGVGAVCVQHLMEHIRPDLLKVELCNDGSGILNDQCGADYVKSRQGPPADLDFSAGEECASFDGDADRIIFFFKSSDGCFQLLDGDRMAALISHFISDLLHSLPFELSFGVVQTAYANGGATEFLQSQMGLPVVCTCTGVKHLHHRAAQFDIGVYFEPNGHGTVLFSQKAQMKLSKAMEDKQLSETSRNAARLLHAMFLLLNQAVGDAISDLLVVEAILIHKKWGYPEWLGMYKDLPYRMLKVKVKDRMAVGTTDFERRCVSPPGLQEAIDTLVTATPQGRAFVRPSGTEDVVRVYAEAEAQELADELAVQVGRKVYELASGIGDLLTF